MSQEQNRTQHIRIFGILLLLAFIAASLFLFASNRATQEQLQESFDATRLQIASGGLNTYRQLINSEYDHLFQDCSERARYDEYIDADSRYMSAGELTEALELHRTCGHFLSARSQFTIQLFEKNIEQLRMLATFFSGPTDKKNASVVVTYWDDIFTLERERAIIFDRLIDIQEEYWRSDLDKALGAITSGEREAAVGALNFEANQRLAQSEELNDEIEEIRKRENIFWGEAFE